MNKLNFFLLIIVGIGMVCGCNLSSRLSSDESGSNSNRNRRQSNSRGSERPTENRQAPRTSAGNSADETGDPSDSADEENDNQSSRESSDRSREENDSPADSGDAARLAGKWVWARTGSGTYSTGGAYMGGNGSRFTYEFAEDGTVEFTGIMNVMQGGCRMQIFKSRRGQANLSGDALTINWSPADFTRDDSCDTAGNYEKTLPAETEALKATFKNSAGQNQLCLTGKDETCFSPAE